MKRTIRIIVPIILILTILLGSVWYLFVYDRALTRDILLNTARYFEKNGQAKISAWFYDRAYSQAGNDDSVAIEMADQFVDSNNYTQAERVLQKAINSNPTTALYTKLCQIFIDQDKVLDAVQLLDNVRDPAIINDLNKLRPAAPTASLENGQYNQYMDVSFECDDGDLYVNTEKEYPSVVDDLYSGPIRLIGGENYLYAVSIADNGLVSPLSRFAYTILDVIEQIDITDDLFDSTIRDLLGIGADEAIFSDDLWEIETLVLPEGVTDFSAIAHFRSLKELTINSGDSGNLSVLQNLPRLKKLSIKNVSVSNAELSIIGNLPELESLTLNHCNLGTTDGLENADSLQHLDLSQNTIRNIDALQNLSGLKELNLYWNVVEDLTPLAVCTSLTNLNVSFNALTSLAPLYGLPNLQTLMAEQNAIVEIAFTPAMTGLEYLSLANNKITDISSIASCAALKELNISNNAVFNISPLTALSNLIVLNFSNNSVSTIPSFDPDGALAIIDGSNNQITSINPLAGLKHLTDVLMDNNTGITSIDELYRCHSLIKVSVVNTQVGSVGILTEHGIIVIK